LTTITNSRLIVSSSVVHEGDLITNASVDVSTVTPDLAREMLQS
jgi:hypothetical protein